MILSTTYDTARRLLAYIDEDASLAANGLPPIPPNGLPPILAGRPYLAALVEDLRSALVHDDELARKGIAVVRVVRDVR